jgi:hypothetical protein
MKTLLTIGVILMALLPATAFARGVGVVGPGQSWPTCKSIVRILNSTEK